MNRQQTAPVYMVRLLEYDGGSSYLIVGNRRQWKTKRSAIQHARDIHAAACKRGGGMFENLAAVIVEDENETDFLTLKVE